MIINSLQLPDDVKILESTQDTLIISKNGLLIRIFWDILDIAFAHDFNSWAISRFATFSNPYTFPYKEVFEHGDGLRQKVLESLNPIWIREDFEK